MTMTDQDTASRPALIRLTKQGQPVVYLPLGAEGWALMNEDDADRLLAAGVPLGLAHLAAVDKGSPHVAVPSARPDLLPVVFLARLVAGASKRQRVRYRNGDRTDLRRGNLRTEERRPLAEQADQDTGDTTQ